MDYLEAQTLLDPIPPPFGKRNMFPEYVPAVVEHPYFPPDAAAVECNNFRLYTETVGSTVKLMVGPGQVGDVFIAAEDMGTLNSLMGKIVFIAITLDGEDGTYTAELDADDEFPEASDTEKAIYLGSISDEGGITQGACGPLSVTVCRNWYAGASPYYGITVF